VSGGSGTAVAVSARLPVREVDRAPGLIYGPVQSRRFGRSLGVNLMPAGLRLCNYDCRYCQCGGVAARHRRCDDPPFPSLDEVERALTESLLVDPEVDDICFAGAGEPTLYPWFREVVARARLVRSRLAPRATVSVLSNGLAAGKLEVRAGLALADRALLKLDAARDDLLHALDRPPAGLTARRLVQILAGMIGIETQTMLVRGAVDNASPPALEALGEALRLIHPRRAHVGTLTRAPAATRMGPRVLPLTPSQLHAAAARLRRLAPAVEIDLY
jgi:wyosine [tRNA(Phe)-imidazoG37] synthetase (radical SAM superfamily)